jgi:chaperonin GroEL
MAHKRVFFHSAAREKLLRGTTVLADAVRVRLGPKSKSVLIQKKFNLPIVCNDGVTIANRGIAIKRGLDRGLNIACNHLQTMSAPVPAGNEKEQVATISAHNDPAIGRMVADAVKKVGDEGVITAEDSKTTETILEVVGSMQFDRGFLSPKTLMAKLWKHWW